MKLEDFEDEEDDKKEKLICDITIELKSIQQKRRYTKWLNKKRSRKFWCTLKLIK